MEIAIGVVPSRKRNVRNWRSTFLLMGVVVTVYCRDALLNAVYFIYHAFR